MIIKTDKEKKLMLLRWLQKGEIDTDEMKTVCNLPKGTFEPIKVEVVTAREEIERLEALRKELRDYL